MDNLEFLPVSLSELSILILQSKVHELAGDDYRIPVLGCVKKWIQVTFLILIQSFIQKHLPVRQICSVFLASYYTRLSSWVL